MANLSKIEVKQIISDAPEGVDRGKLVQSLASKGHILEGYNDNSSYQALNVPELAKTSPITAMTMGTIKGAQESKAKGELEGVKPYDIKETTGLATAIPRGYAKGKELEANRVKVLDEQIAKSTDPNEKAYLESQKDTSYGLKGAIMEPFKVVGEKLMDTPIPSPGIKRTNPETGEKEYVWTTSPNQFFGELGMEIEKKAPLPVKEFAKNQVSNLNTWYTNLPPDRKQQADEILFDTDFLVTMLGAAEGVNLAKAGLGGLKSAATSELTSMAEKKAAKETAEIVGKISAPVTKKETQLAIEQGRFTQGKEGSILGKRPDVITQEKSILEAGDIINKKIPGAAKMDKPTLHAKIDNQITSTAKTLQPELKKTLLSNEQKLSMRKKWDAIKEAQANTPEFANSKVGGKQAQKQFETFLDELDKAPVKAGDWKTLDDLWSTAKRYDDMIPDNIKQANELSDSFTQLRKEMWLENRRILRDAINSEAKGLGIESQKAFNEMSKLYEAKNNILQTVKADVKGKPGWLNKENLIKAGAVYGGTKVFEKATGLNVPFI